MLNNHPASFISRHWPTVVAGLVLFMGVAALYWPSRQFDFVNIDDVHHVQENELVMGGVSVQSLVAAMRNTGPDYWRPVSTISLMIDTDLYKVDAKQPRAWGYHQTNILLQALAAVLLMLALRALTGRLWCSAIVAALFAVHPLRVESVAWITERKDVLSGVFAFASLWAYAAYAKRPSAWRMALTAALFGLGLMSKSVLVTWPAVFVLMDFWPLRRIEISRGWRIAAGQFLPLIQEKILLLIMSFLSCVITMRTGAGAVAALSWDTRLSHAVVSYVRYLAKILWPSELAAYYPYAGVGGAAAWSVWQIIGSATLLLSITFVVLMLIRRKSYLSVGWFWFIGVLVPMVGILQVGSQGLADRFTYLPSIGVTIALVWLTADAIGSGRWGRLIGATATIAALLALMLTTRTYLMKWRSSDVLYEHTLAVTDNNRVVRSFYGDYLYYQGRHDKAIEQFKESIRFWPDDPLAHYKLGWIYGQLGWNVEAQRAFERCLELDPNDADAHGNLALMLWRRGLIDEARRHLDKALQLNPRDAAQYDTLRRQLQR